MQSFERELDIASFPSRRNLKYGFNRVSRSKDRECARTTIRSEVINLEMTASHALFELAATEVFESGIRSFCSSHNLEIFPLPKGPRIKLMS